jgi:putative cell wall-binding protein
LTGDRVGDLVVITKDGFRMSEPGGFSNPIPGNHGHVETLPIPVIIGGGWDGVVGNDVVPGLPVPGLEGVDRTIPKDVRDPGQAENIDIAPTIAWLLGINPPPGGFDGRVLEEAFSRRPQTRLPVADVPSVPLHDRVEGADRLGTAVALSALAFPDPETVDALVLAAAGDFPDALAATPLASALGGPLLLTPSDALAPQVAAEITRLAPSRVVLVGGPSAISEAVEQAVGGLVDEVQRIGGTSRYDTAALIARALTTAGEEGSPLPAPPGDEEQEGDAAELSQVDVILASGENFPDALVAGPLASLSGRVILLTRPDELPEETMAVIDAIDPARVLIAGGPQAVGTAIESRLRADRTVERLGGDSRFDTAALLVERTIREGGLTDRAFVVDGGNFPDALAAGVAVAQLGGMLLPVAGGGLRASGAIADLLDRRTDGLVRVTVVGGPSAVSAALADEIQDRVAEVRSRRGVALPA